MKTEYSMEHLLHDYDVAYNGMDDMYKWKLSTGKVVEDEIYKFGKACREEQ